MYSSSISQFMNSIENNSFHAESIGTQSIAHSAGSSASSCKSISDPQVLLSKAILDLKRSAREGETEELIEYWDTWSYWKRHPFVINNQFLCGQLILEQYHLIILTNLKYKETFKVFSDIKNWLEIIKSKSNEEIFIQLRDQLCAGFFLIFCEDVQESFEYLNEIENILVSEYFEALKGELENKKKQKSIETLELKNNNNGMSMSIIVNSAVFSFKPSFLSATTATFNLLNHLSIENLKKFLLFFNEFAQKILEKLKNKYSLLVQIIRSNSRTFFLFCNRLVRILLKKLRI